MITWDSIVRAKDQLLESGVAAVVSASPPPLGVSTSVERFGAAWIVGLDPAPKYWAKERTGDFSVVDKNGLIRVDLTLSHDDMLIVRETFDAGWRAEVDGRPASVTPYRGVFLAVPVGKGRHRVDLVYDPAEVRAACAVSVGALLLTVLLGTGSSLIRALRFLAKGLGRLTAFGLESNSRSSPDFSTG
jgi:hypothetical protein